MRPTKPPCYAGYAKPYNLTADVHLVRSICKKKKTICLYPETLLRNRRKVLTKVDVNKMTIKFGGYFRPAIILLVLHYSIHHTQPHSVIVNYFLPSGHGNWSSNLIGSCSYLCSLARLNGLQAEIKNTKNLSSSHCIFDTFFLTDVATVLFEFNSKPQNAFVFNSSLIKPTEQFRPRSMKFIICWRESFVGFLSLFDTKTDHNQP